MEVLFNDHIIILVVEVIHLFRLSCLVSVIVDDSLSNLSVTLSIFVIKHDKEKIKSRQQGIWQTNVESN